MASRRNIALQAVTIAGVSVQLGGDNIAARITFGDRATATRGVSRTVYNRIKQPDAQLTLTFYPEDLGNQQMRVLQNVRDAIATAVVAPGQAVNLGNGEIVTWGDSELITPGDFVASQETETVSWVFALDTVLPVQAGVVS